MKHVVCTLAFLAASPVVAHTGAHLHPHGGGNWLAVVLAAVSVGGVMALVHARGRK